MTVLYIQVLFNPVRTLLRLDVEMITFHTKIYTISRPLVKTAYQQINFLISQPKYTGPRSAVGNVSGYRCVSDCRSRGREFDPGPVPYFRGD